MAYKDMQTQAVAMLVKHTQSLHNQLKWDLFPPSGYDITLD